VLSGAGLMLLPLDVEPPWPAEQKARGKGIEVCSERGAKGGEERRGEERGQAARRKGGRRGEERRIAMVDKAAVVV
jgi:hypothetical protein